MASQALLKRLGNALERHQQVFDPELEPRNGLRWLPELRRWQAERLRKSFSRFLKDPRRKPAAEFFLTDLYGDRDFSQRDADIIKVLPMMQRLLPAGLLETVAAGMELSTLTHVLDLAMAEQLQVIAPSRRKLDEQLYAEAYRATGQKRQRSQQINLIESVGNGLAAALDTPGVAMLLKLARGPAKAIGVAELQGFLERGFGAFRELGDARIFIAEIVEDERLVSRRLYAADLQPFRIEPDRA